MIFVEWMMIGNIMIVIVSDVVNFDCGMLRMRIVVV